MKKKIFSIIIILLIIILFFTAASIIAVNHLFDFSVMEYYKLEKSEKIFVIKKGDLIKSIALKLKEDNLIISSEILLLYAKLNNLDKKIKTGQYKLDNSMSIKEILDMLITGNSIFFKITIPEGLTYKETADIIKQNISASVNFDKNNFLILCENKSFLKENIFIDFYGENAEGFLYPETYFYSEDDNETTILKMILNMFNTKMIPLASAELPLNMNFYDVIKLASIVQAEAIFNDEMMDIAGVYVNRLKSNQKLEADPTVIYGMGYRKKRLFFKDLKIISPYNTYIYNGLPPTPICSPNFDALNFTINYSKHNYYYFVADGSGRHQFSKTFGEHKRKIKKIRK